jgi:hypothetical protein
VGGKKYSLNGSLPAMQYSTLAAAWPFSQCFRRSGATKVLDEGDLAIIWILLYHTLAEK